MTSLPSALDASLAHRRSRSLGPARFPGRAWRTSIAGCLAAAAVLVAFGDDGGQAGPAARNAADVYGQAFGLLRFEEGATVNGLGLTHDEWSALVDVAAPEEVAPQLRELFAKAQPALELARQAGALPRADFRLDRSQGFDLLLPHLGQMRALSRLLRADAMMRLESGDRAGAAAALAAQAGIARHASDDGLLISSLVGGAVASLCDDSIQAAMDRGGLDADSAAELVEALAPLGGIDPFRFSAAMEGERDMLSASVLRALDEDGAEWLAGLIGEEAATAIASRDREEVLEELAVGEQLLSEAAAAFREPDPDVATAMIDDIERRLEEGAGGAIAKAMMPALSKALAAKLRVEARMAARMALLRDLAEGRASPSQLANAATWYVAAARAAAAIDAEAQRLIEAARLTDGVLEGEALAALRRVIERRRRSVLEALHAGAEAGRCEFPRDRPRADGLVAVPPYAAGLRAAARMLLVEALLAARGAESAPTPDERAERETAAAKALRSAIRLSEHVANDGALCHAILAQSILRETGEALAAIVGMKALDEAALEALREQVSRLDRIDPLGHRRGLVADRERLIRSLRPTIDAEVRQSRRRVVEKISAADLLTLAAALHGGHGCAPSPDHVLLDVSDLYDAQACQEIVARAVEIWSGRLLRARDADELAQAVRDAAPLPLLVDMARLAAEAPAVIGALDERLRAPTAP